MMKRIYFTWKHNGKRDYVTIDDRKPTLNIPKKLNNQKGENLRRNLFS